MDDYPEFTTDTFYADIERCEEDVPIENAGPNYPYTLILAVTLGRYIESLPEYTFDLTSMRSEQAIAIRNAMRGLPGTAYPRALVAWAVWASRSDENPFCLSARKLLDGWKRMGIQSPVDRQLFSFVTAEQVARWVDEVSAAYDPETAPYYRAGAFDLDSIRKSIANGVDANLMHSVIE